MPTHGRGRGLTDTRPDLRPVRNRMTRGNTIMAWTVGLILLFTALGAITNKTSGSPHPTPTVTVTVTPSPANTGTRK